MSGREMIVARTPEEVAEHQRATDDLARYGGVAILLVVNPDNPENLAASVDVRPGAPCFISVARGLRELADEFELRHAEGPCGGAE